MRCAPLEAARGGGVVTATIHEDLAARIDGSTPRAKETTRLGWTRSSSGTGWWPRLRRSSSAGPRPPTSPQPWRSRASTALPLSVKGGGHNIAGTVDRRAAASSLDMSRMREVTVDAGAKLAHVGPGCRLQDVDRATQAARARDPARLRLRGRRRRPDARRRPRLPHPPLRLDGRQPRGGRDRHRRRRDPHRQPRRERRPLLGAPGRRRQLRRRHPVHVPPARGRPRPSTAA